MTLSAQNSENTKQFIEKGTWLFKGDISTSFRKNEDDFSNETETDIFKTEFNSISISPNVGYTISNNLIVGVNTAYSYSENNSETENNNELLESHSSTNSYDFGLFVRGYKNISNKLLFLLNANSSYGFSNINGSTTKINNFSIGIQPGLTYFVSERIALETTIGNLRYNSSKSTNEERELTNSNFGFSLNSSAITFGIAYYL